jgi:hypothetical protein
MFGGLFNRILTFWDAVARIIWQTWLQPVSELSFKDLPEHPAGFAHRRRDNRSRPSRRHL